ncbi:MAG: lactonase family protein [Armatimonadetes bacterium]|nr:lactonase family protein [Armatimonadota bacterium]
MWTLPLAAVMTMTPSRPEPFLIGTYTSPGGSEGAYTCTIDSETGQFGAASLIGIASSPSFAVWGPKLDTVFVIEEVHGARITSYGINEGGHWKEINAESWNGNGPCHLALSHSGQFVAGAGYSDGTLGFFGVGADGMVSPVLSEFKNTGKGPDAGRQEGSHMHFTAFTPDDRFVLACDLGTDEVLSFPVDAKAGKLGEPLRQKLAPGVGPRHLVTDKSGQHVYVNNELANSVTALRRDPKTGAMESLQTLTTLPPDFKGHNTTAEIVLDPQGKFLYVSNRGHDSVAAYTVGGDGLLTPIGIFDSQIKEPRGMDVDPNGRWLVVAGQNSDDIVSLPIDPKSGRLGPARARMKASKPVCITFQHRRP